MEVDGLLSGKCNFDRPVYFQRRKRRDMLRGYVFLSAEAASYQLILHHDTLRIPAEHDRDFLPCVVDALIGGEYLDSIFVWKCNCRLRLQKCMFRKWRLISLRHHVF